MSECERGRISANLVFIEVDNPDVIELIVRHAFVREEAGRYADNERRWNE